MPNGDPWDAPFEAKHDEEGKLLITCQRWPFVGFDTDEPPSPDEIAAADFGADPAAADRQRMATHLAAASWWTRLWLALLRYFRDNENATVEEALSWPPWLLSRADPHLERARPLLARYRGADATSGSFAAYKSVLRAAGGQLLFTPDVERTMARRLAPAYQNPEVALEGFLHDIHQVLREFSAAPEMAARHVEVASFLSGGEKKVYRLLQERHPGFATSEEIERAFGGSTSATAILSRMRSGKKKIPIESARDARGAGKDVPADASGYRLAP